MTTYVLRKGRMVQKHLAEPLYVASAAAYVISDEMPETRHMANNQHYTSKAKFRQTTRAYNCVEVGNETATLLKPRQPVRLSREQRARSIRQAIEQLRGSR